MTPMFGFCVCVQYQFLVLHLCKDFVLLSERPRGFLMLKLLRIFTDSMFSRLKDACREWVITLSNN